MFSFVKVLMLKINEMKLPIEISPNPLVTSTIEIRFLSSLSSQKIFPIVYQSFSEDLPNFEHINIPNEIRQKNLQLKYLPDYTLLNEDFKLSFSNNVLSFENVGEYKLWGQYFPFISKSISIFLELGIIEKIERIGVRYASVLVNTDGVNDVLNSIPTTNIEGYEQKFEQYRSNFIIDEINLFLQIFNKANTKKNDIEISGVYIDIDASITNEINPDNKIIESIEKLHSIQKKLFYSLLKPEYIASLNPKY